MRIFIVVQPLSELSGFKQWLYATHCGKISVLVQKLYSTFLAQKVEIFRYFLTTLWANFEKKIFLARKFKFASMCDASADQVAATATDDHRDWRIFQLWFHCASVQSTYPSKKPKSVKSKPKSIFGSCLEKNENRLWKIAFSCFLATTNCTMQTTESGDFRFKK